MDDCLCCVSRLITKKLSDTCRVICAISLLIHARALSSSLLWRVRCLGPVTLVGAGKTLSRAAAAPAESGFCRYEGGFTQTQTANSETPLYSAAKREAHRALRKAFVKTVQVICT